MGDIAVNYETYVIFEDLADGLLDENWNLDSIIKLGVVKV